MYVIATDSRKNNEVLFMVDRAHQRKSFWSNRLDDVLKYENKSAARRKAASLLFNNPRVLSLQDAMKIAGESEIDRDLDNAMCDSEAGWDGHKGLI